MNKKAGFISNFILILLLTALGFSIYYLFQYYQTTPIAFKNFTIGDDNIEVNNSISSKQFYPRMRYQDRIINYYISPSCSPEKTDSMKEAFEILKSRTIISFNQVSKSNSVLNILCEDISPEAEEKDHFVAGEGGPSRILNSTLYSVILEGKIALYREGQCDNLNVALHELLHALGFDHNNNPKSILYPTLKCDQMIDEEIIDSINRLYLTNSLPELLFFKANAEKDGRYLNFHIEVLNQGLQSSPATKIGVYAGKEFIQNFDIGEITIGSKKILDVENLKIPSKSDNIIFIIDEKNEIKEIDKNNNKVTLNLVA